MARRYVRDDKGRFADTPGSGSSGGSDIGLGTSPYKGRIAEISRVKYGSVATYEAKWGKTVRW